MKIRIKSHLVQPSQGVQGEMFEWDTSSKPCSIGQLLGEIGAPAHEVGLLFVNQRRVGKDYLLEEGDMIEIVPLLEGG